MDSIAFLAALASVDFLSEPNPQECRIPLLPEPAIRDRQQRANVGRRFERTPPVYRWIEVNVD